MYADVIEQFTFINKQLIFKKATLAHGSFKSYVEWML